MRTFRTAMAVCALATVGVLGSACGGSAGSTAPTTVPMAPTTTQQTTTAAEAAPTAGQATPAADPQPAAGTGGVPRCVTGDLKGTLGTGGGAAGSTIVDLLLTNVSSRTCELVGYPGVSYVGGDDGHQVGPAAEMDGPRNPQVNLAPGKAAAASLRLVNVLNFDAAACKPGPVKGLRVYPPGDTASLFVPMTSGQQGCQTDPKMPQMFVQSVKPA